MQRHTSIVYIKTPLNFEQGCGKDYVRCDFTENIQRFSKYVFVSNIGQYRALIQSSFWIFIYRFYSVLALMIWVLKFCFFFLGAFKNNLEKVTNSFLVKCVFVYLIQIFIRSFMFANITSKKAPIIVHSPNNSALFIVLGKRGELIFSTGIGHTKDAISISICEFLLLKYASQRKSTRSAFTHFPSIKLRKPSHKVWPRIELLDSFGINIPQTTTHNPWLLTYRKHTVKEKFAFLHSRGPGLHSKQKQNK